MKISGDFLLNLNESDTIDSIDIEELDEKEQDYITKNFDSIKNIWFATKNKYSKMHDEKIINWLENIHGKLEVLDSGAYNEGTLDTNEATFKLSEYPFIIECGVLASVLFNIMPDYVFGEDCGETEINEEAITQCIKDMINTFNPEYNICSECFYESYSLKYINTSKSLNVMKYIQLYNNIKENIDEDSECFFYYENEEFDNIEEFTEHLIDNATWDDYENIDKLNSIL